MTDDRQSPAPGTDALPTGTVAQGVLSQFLDALGATEDLADIAPALRKVVLEDGVFAEPAIRAALFPDAP
jgi:hypothetical protein